MALPAEKPQNQPPAAQTTASNMADWFEVYYQNEPAANVAVAPNLGALEQMFAYY